ncbi:Rrf2 family transcriptional regulator [Cetobacterium somerae]
MISKNIEYGYLILKKLQVGKMLSSEEILKDIVVPKRLGLKILTKLSNSGLIKSKKGKFGGFIIQNKEITFLDLFLALEMNNIILEPKINEELDSEYYKKIIEVGCTILVKLDELKVFEGR